MKKTHEAEQGTQYGGIGIGKRCADGRLKFFCRSAPVPRAQKYLGRDAERQRLYAALDTVEARISAVYQRARHDVGDAEAEIFAIHAMLLRDEDFLEALEKEIADGRDAVYAVEHASEKYVTTLSSLSDPYLRARAADMRDITRQLTNALLGARERAEEDEDTPYILVADDLTPSETVSLDKHLILGFVTFTGTPNSHTSILARAMGIPALVGVGKIDVTMDGQYALLNAVDGTLIVSPNEEQTMSFKRIQTATNAQTASQDRSLRSLMHVPAITQGGRRVLIYANVGDRSEAEAAHTNGADGIGLLRSEFLYLSLDRYPTEEELYHNYRAIAETMPERRIVIRTLDIGADKRIAYFDLPSEENPALGFRGVRLCLSREEIFKTQLRAILRASVHGNLSIMIPMIVSLAEVRVCRRLLEECKAELRRDGYGYDADIEFGIMVETPAAAVMSDELAAEVDFFSVGTNDLLQYTLAADRQNPRVSAICEENVEPVMRLIARAAESIHRHGGWIGICGELAADLCLTQRFVDLGIDELSVSVPYLLSVREKVIECK